MLAPAAAKLIAVAPRGHLGTQRAADAHELESLTQLREPDVVGRDTDAGLGELALALLDRFPPLLDRRQVPALAAAAHDPEPPFRRVEG